MARFPVITLKSSCVAMTSSSGILVPPTVRSSITRKSPNGAPAGPGPAVWPGGIKVKHRRRAGPANGRWKPPGHPVRWSLSELESGGRAPGLDTSKEFSEKRDKAAPLFLAGGCHPGSGHRGSAVDSFQSDPSINPARRLRAPFVPRLRVVHEKCVSFFRFHGRNLTASVKRSPPGGKPDN